MTYHPTHLTRLSTELFDAPDAELTLAPKTEHDVAAVLRYASERGLAVQVWGGGTRQGYGSPPPADIVLSMEALGSVEAWEPDDLTIVVGTGARITDIESMLAERSQTAVLPEVPGGSTVGGTIATGVSSLRRGRLYGTRERVLEVRVVTGDGRVVRAGARVVKNVTGYDLPRLCVGAFGSLGVIVSVCLKLLPTPPASAMVRVESPDQAGVIARPLAVLETESGVDVFVWGTETEVETKVQRLGGKARDGHEWPRDPAGPIRLSLRVPPALTAEAIERLPEGWGYLAIHGVGEVRCASSTLEGAFELRSWAESAGGHLVVVDHPDTVLDGFDPWGMVPSGADLQRRLIEQFDPARIINPGRLPGGL